MTPDADDWDAERYRRHAGFVPALDAPVVALLAPGPGWPIRPPDSFRRAGSVDNSVENRWSYCA